MYVCLSGCLSGWLAVCMYVCLSGWLAGCMYVCLSGWLAGWLSVWLAGCLSGWLAVCMYVCVAPRVRVHKGRGIRSNQIRGFGVHPKKKKPIPKMGSSRPPGPIYVTLLDLGCPQPATTLFSTSAALSHDPIAVGKLIPWQDGWCNADSWYIQGVHQVELQIHTDLFFFWMYTGKLILVECCFRQGYPFSC